MGPTSAWWRTWPSSTPGCKRSLVGLDVALLDERPPERVLVTEELAKFGWRARLGIDALRVDAVANLRIVDGLLHLERQAIERGALQVGRREEAVPRAALVVRQSLLGDGRKIGRTAMALHRADAEDLELARLRERQERRQRGEDHVDLPAHHVGEGRGVALVRDVDEVDVGFHGEEHRRQVQGRAVSR